MFTKCILSGALLIAAFHPLQAQKTQINAQYLSDYAFDGNPPSTPLRDQNGVGLATGTNAAGDGDIFQIGYFSAGMGVDVTTFSQSHWDSFTPLTSVGGNHLTTIGDAGGVSGGFGIFGVSITLDPNFDPELPPLPTQYPSRLGIRIFNGATVAGSTHYNTVTSNSSAWTMSQPNTPTPLPSLLDLDNPGGDPFVWESGATGHFQTALAAAPEPSVALLALSALGLLGLHRRRS